VRQGARGRLHLLRAGGGASIGPADRGAAGPQEDRRGRLLRDRPRRSDRLPGQRGQGGRGVTRIWKHRLFWPLASLLGLIVINSVARPQFLSITMRDGELYGALINILRNSAPL